MAYEVVMSYHLHMPSYFLGTFTEYPKVNLGIIRKKACRSPVNKTSASLYFIYRFYCYSEYYNPHTYLKRNIPKNSGQWKFGFSKSMGFHDRK